MKKAIKLLIISVVIIFINGCSQKGFITDSNRLTYQKTYKKQPIDQGAERNTFIDETFVEENAVPNLESQLVELQAQSNSEIAVNESVNSEEPTNIISNVSNSYSETNAISNPDSLKTSTRDKGKPSQDYYRPRVEGLSLTSFIVSILGLFVFAFPLGLVALTFGLIGLVKILSRPADFRGKGYAIAGIIIGLINIIFGIFLIMKVI